MGVPPEDPPYLRCRLAEYPLRLYNRKPPLADWGLIRPMGRSLLQ